MTNHDSEHLTQDRRLARRLARRRGVRFTTVTSKPRLYLVPPPPDYAALATALRAVGESALSAAAQMTVTLLPAIRDVTDECTRMIDSLPIELWLDADDEPPAAATP